MAEKVRVLHALSLNKVGGLECLFSDYLPLSADPRLEHHVLVVRERVHPRFQSALDVHAASVRYAKHLGPLRIPGFFRRLRRDRYARCVRAVSPDLVVLWNSLGDADQAELARRGRRPARVLYFEHGAAWRGHRSDEARRFLEATDAVLANSLASRRMLELLYASPEGRAEVCPNGVRLTLGDVETRPREAPRDRPLRLGFAGRLVGLKGPALAIHALNELRDRGADAALRLAGTGRDMEKLQELALRLGLADGVEFAGVVDDMVGFYQDVDVLLCPSIREPFGLVCAEAAFCGCPVVAPLVDGIPEVVESGRTGLLLRPSRPLESYAELLAEEPKMPRLVYDPEADAVVAPRLLDPARIADAVVELCSDPVRYGRISAEARRMAAERFDFRAYCRRLDARLAAAAGLEPDSP